ncbi:MAG: 16S rRNA (guanine(527)-N(7))-methyltransferase RsmG [Sphingobacteriales bacterium]|nr:MAG: 16S rRNA (guanine(527)-N(7))-methyltransferase RsmG [Sphingobacteriales bacterium]
MNNIDIITKYFHELNPAQIKQFEQLGIVFPEWNDKINLISRKDVENLYERHILHSLGIAKVINFSSGTQIMDVGTGGGFPGIPLAIMFPEVAFTLVDSIGKKIKVVQEVAEALELKNVRAFHARAEEIPGKFDFITGRAVTDINAFYGWVRGKIKTKQQNGLPNGILYLKGGDMKEELAPFRKRAQVFPLDHFFEEEFFETKAVVYIESAGK